MNLLPALLLALTWPVAAQPTVERSRLVALSASVVKVEVQRRQGGYSIGSGVVIAPGKIATNCHVTRDAATVQVQRGGVRWPADAQASRPDLDLCVLRVPELRGDPVDLGSADQLKPGDPVAALGFTGGAGLQVSDGQVIALHRHASGQVVQTSNWFTSGASGGGLFDERLRLVGLLTFRLRGGASHYFAAPADWLQPLLADNAAFEPIAPLAADALPFWQQAAGQQPWFLQAAALEQALQWPALLNLTGTWAERDQDDAEPWYLRGLSLERLDRLDDARQALEAALRRQPDSLQAWHRLGLVLIRQGQLAQARQALSRLHGREPLLAEQLQQALDQACRPPTLHPAECRSDPA